MARRADAELIEALEAARIHPIWDRYKRITPVLPDAPDGVFVSENVIVKCPSKYVAAEGETG